MAGQKHTHSQKRTLQTALLCTMLLLFLVVYNRNLVAKEVYPDYVMQKAVNEKLGKPANVQYINAALDSLRDGYLVTISGKDTKSELFSSVNQKDKRYAYAGLVFIENNYPFIYHIALPSGNRPGGLVRDSIESYIGARNVTGFGIYKLPLSRTQITAAQDLIRTFYQKGIAYDNQYRLDTDAEMYPAEFVYKVLIRATGNEKFIAYTKAGPYTFVSVDNLFLRPQNQKIYSAVFQ
mgnify:CR=1 FL=1